jgi:hypothetical protein
MLALYTVNVLSRAEIVTCLRLYRDSDLVWVDWPVKESPYSMAGA